MSTTSFEAREARRLVWELGMFYGLWVTQADKLFPLFSSESNTDFVLVWLRTSLGPFVSIIISKGVGNLDLSGFPPR